MNTWTCPHCKRKMHSSNDHRKEKLIKCVYKDREKEFPNKYYEGETDNE